MKTLLLALLLFISTGLYAQLLFNQNGDYKGAEFKSIHVDFTKSPKDALSEPVVDEIRQYDCLGLIKFFIANRPVLGEKRVSANTLFNDNPEINGANNIKSPAVIYFPTLKNGAGAIRIKGWVGGNIPQTIQLSYYSEEQQKWVWKGGIPIPNDGSNLVETNIGIKGPVRLKLVYNRAAWLSILSIEVSAHGDSLTSNVEEKARP